MESQGRLFTEKIERVQDRVDGADHKIDRVERRLDTLVEARVADESPSRPENQVVPVSSEVEV